MSKYSQQLSEFKNRGGLFLPDDEIYKEIKTIKDIETLAKKIFVWLCIKPMNVHYSLKPESVSNLDNFLIYINSDKNIFENVALISKQCIEYYLKRKNLESNQEVTERAIIDYGLGILVVNSFKSTNTLGKKLVKNKPGNDYEVLTSLSNEDFSRRLKDYIEENSLSKSSVLEHILINNRRYLGFSINESNLRNELFVTEENSLNNKLKIKYLISISCFCLVFVLGAFLYSQRPESLPKEVISQKEKVVSLENSYRECIKELQEKEQNYNMDDIYMVRQIQAHFNKCTSLKNNYEYNVQQYNKMLAEN